MKKKSLQDALDQLKESQGEEKEGFSELSADEADELAGGTSGDKNTGCPVYNTGCPQS